MDHDFVLCRASHALLADETVVMSRLSDARKSDGSRRKVSAVYCGEAETVLCVLLEERLKISGGINDHTNKTLDIEIAPFIDDLPEQFSPDDSFNLSLNSDISWSMQSKTQCFVQSTEDDESSVQFSGLDSSCNNMYRAIAEGLKLFMDKETSVSKEDLYPAEWSRPANGNSQFKALPDVVAPSFSKFERRCKTSCKDVCNATQTCIDYDCSDHLPENNSNHPDKKENLSLMHNSFYGSDFENISNGSFSESSYCAEIRNLNSYRIDESDSDTINDYNISLDKYLLCDFTKSASQHESCSVGKPAFYSNEAFLDRNYKTTFIPSYFLDAVNRDVVEDLSIMSGGILSVELLNSSLPRLSFPCHLPSVAWSLQKEPSVSSSYEDASSQDMEFNRVPDSHCNSIRYKATASNSSFDVKTDPSETFSNVWNISTYRVSPAASHTDSDYFNDKDSTKTESDESTLSCVNSLPHCKPCGSTKPYSDESITSTKFRRNFDYVCNYDTISMDDEDSLFKIQSPPVLQNKNVKEEVKFVKNETINDFKVYTTGPILSMNCANSKINSCSRESPSNSDNNAVRAGGDIICKIFHNKVEESLIKYFDDDCEYSEVEDFSQHPSASYSSISGPSFVPFPRSRSKKVIRAIITPDIIEGNGRLSSDQRTKDDQNRGLRSGICSEKNLYLENVSQLFHKTTFTRSKDILLENDAIQRYCVDKFDEDIPIDIGLSLIEHSKDRVGISDASVTKNGLSNTTFNSTPGAEISSNVSCEDEISFLNALPSDPGGSALPSDPGGSALPYCCTVSSMQLILGIQTMLRGKPTQSCARSRSDHAEFTREITHL